MMTTAAAAAADVDDDADHLQRWYGQQVVHGLCDVGAVYAVVIRHRRTVVILHLTQISQQNIRLNLQLAD